ncbi:DASH complex, subunit Spc19 [Microthyrium microscopicum]|uniref:DASH complex subunit SPC19 n=1 Tax=Microthyrium microscopicum TaxID=703497 RepID=A0A6A6USS1_9PEZI|nr:DASH complex, subunit Spc19 [Microthyrium microscopicum]
MNNSLEGCVSSLRESLSLLDSSIKTLDAGVNDFPRLSKVLQSTRHFELVSEPDLHSAQSALRSEIQPEVNALLNRVEAHLDKLERREQALMAKCELQEGRLGDAPSAATPRTGLSGSTMFGSGGAVPVAKMNQVRQKKERLSYAIDRLQLEAQQKERQLRKSLAAPAVLD